MLHQEDPSIVVGSVSAVTLDGLPISGPGFDAGKQLQLS